MPPPQDKEEEIEKALVEEEAVEALVEEEAEEALVEEVAEEALVEEVGEVEGEDIRTTKNSQYFN